MQKQLLDRPALSRILLPALAAACAAGILVLDIVTRNEIAIAVLYVAVVLMAVSFCQPRGVLLVTLGCMALTVLSYPLSPGAGLRVTAIANCALSLAAIGVTAVLALKNRSAIVALHDAQAELAHVTRLTSLGELVASIAHEINQPLTGVVSNAQASLRWLSSEPPNLPEARVALERIANDGMRASAVIQRVRALARKAPLERELLDINDAIIDVAALMRDQLRKDHVSLTLQLANDLPVVLGDRVQLQQVILNLIMNAVEAMTGQTTTTRELMISSNKDDTRGVIVAIRDNGPGLGLVHPGQIFDAFYTTKPEGMGMGLAISRTIIEAHRGLLWAEPNVPRGAVLQFNIPANEKA